VSRSASADQRIGMVLKRAEQALLRAKNAALKPVGLTLAQYVALGELERRPAVAAAALARACLVSPQAMMVVLKSLDDQGLISRLPHPRHPNVLELRITDAGREALDAGRRAVAPLERRVLGAFSRRELDTLAELLHRMIEATDVDDAGRRETDARSERPSGPVDHRHAKAGRPHEGSM
jgi:DNA-binding MarR family transcriptional regulator